jgi:hypothetical protein
LEITSNFRTIVMFLIFELINDNSYKICLKAAYKLYAPLSNSLFVTAMKLEAKKHFHAAAKLLSYIL